MHSHYTDILRCTVIILIYCDARSLYWYTVMHGQQNVKFMLTCKCTYLTAAVCVKSDKHTLLMMIHLLLSCLTLTWQNLWLTGRFYWGVKLAQFYVHQSLASSQAVCTYNDYARSQFTLKQRSFLSHYIGRWFKPKYLLYSRIVYFLKLLYRFAPFLAPRSL
jgi:hypothetical protein